MPLDAAPEPAEDVETNQPSPRRSIAVGADHGGFAMKERIAFKLAEQGWDVTDCGTDSLQSVDYPDFAHAVARLVSDGTCAVGIVIDGAGIGSAMVANKLPGVRAAACYDLSQAANSREHNHANVLTLGAGLVGESLAWQIVETWLATPWAEGRHARRVAQITEVEREYRKGER
ncbi:MAG: ribose 5-phosphate isomerase B [Acidimicrobiia bacterium]|nr:ribose 5-phosphate isomerase B [Acidimicrobiia bacterium]